MDVPKELLPKLDKLTSVQAIWFHGQIEEFLLKLKSHYKHHIEKTAKQIGFKHPIVGVHIRRTDKIVEADFRSILRYMEKVEEFYDILELTQKIDKRRIYLATDEPAVIEKIFRRYSKSFEIIVNANHSTEAKNDSTRFISPLGIITDVNLLSRCDYFVGTLSSNIGRRIFEFMFRQNLDAPERVASVDSNFYEIGNLVQKYKVLINHNSSNNRELQIKAGEIVSSGDHNILTGLTKVTYQGKKGLIPSYKIEEIVEAVDFPKFNDGA